jgi:hypothetical protein
VSGARDELEAAIAARRELGPTHEDELVESFLARIERRLEERRPAAPERRERPGDQSVRLAVISLALGIPLTAIASSNAGLAAVIVVWIGIVLVNVAARRL